MSAVSVRRAIAAIAFSVFGCADGQLRVDVDVSADYYFVVMLDDVGRPIAVSDVGSGGAMPNAAVAETASGTTDVVTVSLTTADIDEAARGFMPARWGQLSLAPTAPPSAKTLTGADDNAFARVRLPGSAIMRVRSLDDSNATTEPADPALLDRLTLEVPIDENWCRPAGRQLVPFGYTKELMPYTRRLPGMNPDPDDSDHRIDRVLRIDANRVLIEAGKFVYLVERGGDIVHPESLPAPHVGPAKYLHRPAIAASAGPGWGTWQGMALLPGTPLQVWIVTRRFRPGASADFHAHRFIVEEAGLTRVETATIASFPDEPLRGYVGRDILLRDAAVDAQGRLIVVGEPDLVFVQDLGASTFSPGRPMDPPLEGLEIRVVVGSARPGAPHLFLRNDGNSFFGDATGTQRWRGSFIGEDVRGADFQQLLESADGRERWVFGSDARLLRNLDGDAWLPVTPDVPRDLTLCAAVTDDRAAFVHDWMGGAVSADRVWLVSKRCTAAVVVPRDDPTSCSSPIVIEGEPPLQTREEDRYFSVDGGAGFVTIGADRGTLLEVQVD